MVALQRFQASTQDHQRAIDGQALPAAQRTGFDFSRIADENVGSYVELFLSRFCLLPIFKQLQIPPLHMPTSSEDGLETRLVLLIKQCVELHCLALLFEFEAHSY